MYWCKIFKWAVSDSGSTGALQALGKGSIPLRSTKFKERGYDVVVAFDLAKVDVRVRFPLPAPLLEYFLYIYKNE